MFIFFYNQNQFTSRSKHRSFELKKIIALLNICHSNLINNGSRIGIQMDIVNLHGFQEYTLKVTCSMLIRRMDQDTSFSVDQK